MASVITSTSYGYAITTPSKGSVCATALRIKQIILHPSVVGDYVNFQDNDSNDICKLIATTTQSSVEMWLCDSQFNGLKISQCIGTNSSISILIV